MSVSMNKLFMGMAIQAIITASMFLIGLPVNSGQQAIAAIVFIVLGLSFSRISEE